MQACPQTFNNSLNIISLMEFQPLQCCICFVEYDLTDHVPRILPECGHTICEECLTLLLERSDANCPLDKTVLTYRYTMAKEFPINFTVRQLVEDSLGKEICKIHNQRTTQVCLTDKCKLCVNCVLYNGHREHDIKPLEEVQKEIDINRKGLENMLVNVVEYCNARDAVLGETKQMFRKLIEDQFQELMFVMRMKKQQLVEEVDAYFANEMERPTKDNTDLSDIKNIIVLKIAQCKSFNKTQDIKDMLQQDFSELMPRVSKIIRKEGLHDIKKGFTDIASNFEKLVSGHIELLFRLETPLKSTDKMSSEHTTKNGLTHCDTNKTLSIRSIVLNTSLSFATNKGVLEIRAINRNPKHTYMNLEAWREVNEIEIILNSSKFYREDRETLYYLMSTLTNINSIKLVSSDQSEILVENLLDFCSAIFVNAKNLQKLDISFLCSDIGDILVTLLAKRVFSRISNLKSFSLNLSKTNTTDTALNALTESLAKLSKGIETFVLYLRGTPITEEALLRLFSLEMPSIKRFELDLSSTAVRDNELMYFAKNSLPVMENIQTFGLWVFNTEVTDEGVCELLVNLSGAKMNKLTLDFQSTKVSDESIQELVQTKVPSMKKIEDFIVWLGDTNVTKQMRRKANKVERCHPFNQNRFWRYDGSF